MANRSRSRSRAAAEKLRTGRRSGKLVLAPILWLLAVWIAAFGNVEPLTVVGGIIVAVAVHFLFPLGHTPGVFRVRLIPLLELAARFLYDLVRSGLQVSWRVLHPEPRLDGIVSCDVRTSVPEYLTILAAMTSLIPGSIVIEVDRHRQKLIMHCLDIPGQGGAAGIRRATRAQEARILRALAPRSTLVKVGLAGRPAGAATGTDAGSAEPKQKAR